MARNWWTRCDTLIATVAAVDENHGLVVISEKSGDKRWRRIESQDAER
jgi:hypothetical protein